MAKPLILDGKTAREAVAAELKRFLGEVLKHARLDLSFVVRMEAEAAPATGSGRLEEPEIVVDFQGRDQDLLLERNAELLKPLQSPPLPLLRSKPLFPR